MAKGKSLIRFVKHNTQDLFTCELDQDVKLIHLFSAYRMMRNLLIDNMIHNGMFEDANIDTNDMVSMIEFLEDVIKKSSDVLNAVESMDSKSNSFN